LLEEIIKENSSKLRTGALAMALALEGDDRLAKAIEKEQKRKFRNED
jgi:hypothetical protein